ncbi:pirin-like C-terminal cupin domain-containing protein [Lachnoclostridium sp. Marseille-P6806]|uniref:pirin-like C-terminal cupin domain-containing protein n=1 Tax=Lachnoclostridium sp. Marseille-P6806 TaxID=2364793 RepID=UPI001F5EC0B0|nr:pirin-like C-terminal cupin domain-containing protein [Lachnoclostridium sp. Marseille-P6806]
MEGGLLRLVSGSFQDEEGWQGGYLPLDFYDIHLYSSRRLDEPVAWYGPIVMNTREELAEAFADLI